MAIICLPRVMAKHLKDVFAKGEINIEQLYDMTSQERRDFFSKHVGKESGSFVNTGFEKAIVSKQKTALSTWVEETFKGTKKQKQTMLDKVHDIEEAIDLSKNEEFLEDFVADKLGVSVTPEEVMNIKEKAEAVTAANEKINGEVKIKFNNDKHNQGVLNYFKENEKLNNYMASLNPQPRTKIALSTIGRGNMLMSPKSIALNIESNTIVGSTEFLIRRMENGRISGSNPKAQAQYIKWVNKIYDETSIDITRMLNSTSGAFQGEKVSSAAGPGVIRKIGRFYEDTIYKLGLGKPDMVASSFAFSDSANLASTAMAKKEGLSGDALQKRALNIFEDSTDVEPKTKEGKMIREQAMKDAFESTYTNDGYLSNLVLNSMRKPLNKIYDGLGEFVIPFAKTPANVIEISADYGGLGAVKALTKTAKAFTSGNKTLLESASKDAMRSGVGMFFAYLITSWLKPEDYVGEYPISSKEKALLDSKNAVPNSIKLGGKYVSLDYLGPLGAPVIGFLRAKKYGKEGDYKSKVKEYTTGIIQQFLRTPGVKEIKEITATTLKKIREPFSEEYEQMKNDLINDIINDVPPRLIPAIVTDIAKMTDKTQRKVNYDKPLTRIQAKVPFWSQELPPKSTVLGVRKNTEVWWSQLLFGARVKTAIDTKLTKELTYLERAGQLPAISNPEYTNKRFKELKKQIGNTKFTKVMEQYGSKLNNRLSSTIKHPEYKQMTDKEKKKILDSIKGQVMNEVLLQSGYNKAN